MIQPRMLPQSRVLLVRKCSRSVYHFDIGLRSRSAQTPPEPHFPTYSRSRIAFCDHRRIIDRVHRYADRWGVAIQCAIVGFIGERICPVVICLRCVPQHVGGDRGCSMNGHPRAVSERVAVHISTGSRNLPQGILVSGDGDRITDRGIVHRCYRDGYCRIRAISRPVICSVCESVTAIVICMPGYSADCRKRPKLSHVLLIRSRR